MPWPLRIIDPEYGESGWPIGGCWYASASGIGHRPLSPEYQRDHVGKRPPIVVVLPERNAAGEVFGWPFSPDECTTDSDHGWVVTGELPNISVSPSINAVGAYHGFITDGVLTDGLL